MYNYTRRIYTVYKGLDKNGKLVYIGTTVQNPEDRFRWHKSNGKDLQFKVIKQFDNSKEMLNLEFELIKKYNPELNTIKHRKQNLNVRLTAQELESRKGNKEWCQVCLKRRVNSGYTTCYYCLNGGNKIGK